MGQGVILLVEDDVNDEALTIRALKKSKVANDVVVAHDGAEAIDFLFGTGQYAGRDPQELPVVVLLDLKLPRLDGLDVLRQLRTNELTRFLPVVVLTSSAEEKDIAQCYELGVNSYVCKPVEFEKFINAVGLLGMYWLLINKPPL